jgi:hypothetical protein
MTAHGNVTYARRVYLLCNDGAEANSSINPPQLVMNITVSRVGLAE